MRRIFLAAGLIACAGLAGCDEPTNTAATTTVAPPAPTNQMAAAAPAPAPVVHHRRHHHHRQSYAEYQSQNVYSGSAEYNGEPSEDNAPQTYQDQDASEVENTQVAVWIDGYGHRHYGAPARAAASPDSLERRKPWRGYNDDWDN